jgi:hypothetical protein
MAVVDQTGQNIAAAANIHEGDQPTGASALSPAADFKPTSFTISTFARQRPHDRYRIVRKSTPPAV